MFPIYPGLTPTFIPTREQMQPSSPSLTESNAASSQKLMAPIPVRSNKGCTIQSVAEGKRAQALLREDRNDLSRRFGEVYARRFDKAMQEQVGAVVYRTKKLDEAIATAREAKTRLVEEATKAPKLQPAQMLYHDVISSRYNQPMWY